jgi:hypothetical protein
MYRKVKQTDIDNLKLSSFNFNAPETILGNYSAVYHQPHTSNEV